MKYIYTFIFTILLIQFSVRAQSNYKPGLVATTAGDTIRGYINYKEWEQNPNSISFKTALTDKTPQEFTPKNSTYFEISGLAAYQRYEGEVSADRVDLDNLGTRPSNKTRAVETFLKILQKGPNVRLLSFTDLLKPRYFLQDSKSKMPQELVYKRYMDEKNQIVGLRTFTAQLWQAATKYGKEEDDDLKYQIENAKYNAVDLIRIVGLINGLSYQQIQQIEEENHKILFFAGLGANWSITKAYYEGKVAEQHAIGSIMPKILFGFDAFLNPNVQRLVFRAELGVTIANHETELLTSSKSRTILKFDQIIVSASPQIIYNIYNKEKFKWYVGGGFAANYSNYSNLEFADKITGSDGIEITEKSRERDLYKLWISLPVRTGIILNKKIDAGIQYTMRSALASYSPFAISSLSILASFYFNQKLYQYRID